MHSIPGGEPLWRDLKYAVRVLRKTPGFTLTAVLTLGLTIGANTAVFSIVDALLIRPLPYPDADRLSIVAIKYESASRGISGEQQAMDGRTWELIRDHARTVDAAVYSDFNMAGGVNLVTEAGPMFVSQQRISAGFFRVLGVSPLVGREFETAEDVPNGPAVAVLSHTLWQRAFRGDANVIGRTIALKGEPYSVVGVMPAHFRSSIPADVWTPIRPSTKGEGEGTNYTILARLRPGQTWEHANAEIGAIGLERFKQYRRPPDWTGAMGLKPLQQGRTEGVRQQLVVLWASVLVVLLIACINVAGLLLARGGVRTREIATRMALGSGRRAVIRQHLVESVVLALGGAVPGVALGAATLSLLAGAAREVFGVRDAVSLDGRVLGVTLLASLGCALLFGIAPAWQASRLEVQPTLSEAGARGATAATRWPRRILIVAEVALGVVLLVCAGLFVRTFMNLRGLQPGFDPRGVVAATVSLDDAGYRDPARVARLFEDSLARIRQAPGVEAAAVSLGLPYTRLLNIGFKRLDGRQAINNPITNLSYVTPGFFETLRIPIVAGRAFEARDNAESEGALIINQAFARRYFKDEDPIGRRVATSGGERTIVGIAGDVQLSNPGWGNFGPIAAPPICYLPVAQTNADFLRVVHTWFSPVWIVRSARGTQGLEGVVRSAVTSTDPRLPVARVQSMEEVQARATSAQQFMAVLLLSLGGIAALLAAIGIHGLIAASVTERTRELGIRLALGATTGQAMRAVVGVGLALAIAGIVLGAWLSSAAAKMIQSQLWGVPPNDPVTFAGVTLTLLVVATAASVLPALRILRLDPAVTLRAE